MRITHWEGNSAITIRIYRIAGGNTTKGPQGTETSTHSGGGNATEWIQGTADEGKGQ